RRPAGRCLHPQRAGADHEISRPDHAGRLLGGRPGVRRASPCGPGDSMNTDSRLDDALERILTERYSCRAFRPDPVPRDILEQMFAMAQRTPSWCNSQAWQVILTSGEATEKFRTAMYAAASTRPGRSDLPPPQEYRGVYKTRRREAGYGLYRSLGIERHDSEGRGRQLLENFRFFGAPHVAV